MALYVLERTEYTFYRFGNNTRLFVHYYKVLRGLLFIIMIL